MIKKMNHDDAIAYIECLKFIKFNENIDDINNTFRMYGNTLKNIENLPLNILINLYKVIDYKTLSESIIKIDSLKLPISPLKRVVELLKSYRITLDYEEIKILELLCITINKENNNLFYYILNILGKKYHVSEREFEYLSLITNLKSFNKDYKSTGLKYDKKHFEIYTKFERILSVGELSNLIENDIENLSKINHILKYLDKKTLKKLVKILIKEKSNEIEIYDYIRELSYLNNKDIIQEYICFLYKYSYNEFEIFFEQLLICQKNLNKKLNFSKYIYHNLKIMNGLSFWNKKFYLKKLPHITKNIIETHKNINDLTIKELYKSIKKINTLGNIDIGDIVTTQEGHICKVVKIDLQGYYIEYQSQDYKVKGPYTYNQLKKDDNKYWEYIEILYKKYSVLVLHNTDAYGGGGASSSYTYHNYLKSMENNIGNNKKYTISCFSLSPNYSPSLCIPR
ncbi:MAG: hypothetical protein ACMXX9_04215 [Candidatus Woesearchaeota archaeon]